MAELSPEAHARLIWCLMAVLYSVFALRCWALRKVKYSFTSPRGISSMCIIVTILFTSLLAGMTTWSLVGPYEDSVDYVLDFQKQNYQTIGQSSIQDAINTLSSATTPTSSLPVALVTDSAASPTSTLTPTLKPEIESDTTDTVKEIASSTTAAAKETATEKSSSVFKTTEEVVAMTDAEFETYKNEMTDAEFEEFKKSPQASVRGNPSGGADADGADAGGALDVSELSDEQKAKLPPAVQAQLKAAGLMKRNLELQERQVQDIKTKEEADALAKTITKETLMGKGGEIPDGVTVDGEEDLSETASKIGEGDIRAGYFELDGEKAYQFEVMFKVNFASMAIFYTALWLAKASFLVFYFEFSSSLTQRTRRLLYASSVAMVLTYFFTMLVHLMWCLPIEDNWTRASVMQIDTCRADIAPSIINAVINVLTDLLLACTFFAIIRSIKRVARNDFRAASLILFTGCLTILVAIIRLACLCALMTSENKAVNEAAQTELNGTSTIHRAIRESVMGYPEVEAILAAIATCLPALRALFRQSQTAKNFFGSSSAQMTAPPTYNSSTGTMKNGQGFVNMAEKDPQGGPVSAFKFS